MDYPYLSDKQCPICNEFIIITRERDNKKKFCSLPCYYRSQKEDPTQEWIRRPIENRNCKVCGEFFTTDQNKIFCSKRCAKIKVKKEDESGII